MNMLEIAVLVELRLLTPGVDRGRAVAESHASDDPAGTPHRSLDYAADEL
jgi:hypothetical protein